MLSPISWDAETVLTAGMFAVPIAAIVAGAWSKLAKAQSENDLKLSRVERSMSAEEIERVMAARAPDSKK
jgi:hypothetical protein